MIEITRWCALNLVIATTRKYGGKVCLQLQNVMSDYLIYN